MRRRRRAPNFARLADELEAADDLYHELVRRPLDSVRAWLTVLLAPRRHRSVFAGAVTRWAFARQINRERLLAVLQRRSAI